MSAIVLDIRGLVVAFPSRQESLRAIDGVSLTIAAGQVLGVVGESGAGKSVLGSSINGLLPPPGRIMAGEVLLNGQRIDNLPHRQLRALRGRDIGVIFQDPLTSLNPLFTIGDQLVETIRTHCPIGAPAAYERAIGLLHDVGIPSPAMQLRSYPHQLSGGMRQRTVIALALAADPSLIIADEPTTALDVSVQAQIIGLIRKLATERSKAVMLVTHDMGVIAEIADVVAVMYAGRIVEIGRKRDILQAPKHPYTKGLIAAIPEIGQDVERLVQIDGAMPKLDAIPSGCAFWPRCPEAMARCRHDQPTFSPGAERQVACWLHAPAMTDNEA
jgi:peptide/nickel transport system ATP-binding protein